MLPSFRWIYIYLCNDVNAVKLWQWHQDDVFDDYNHSSDLKKNGSSGGYPILTGRQLNNINMCSKSAFKSQFVEIQLIFPSGQNAQKAQNQIKWIFSRVQIV